MPDGNLNMNELYVKAKETILRRLISVAEEGPYPQYALELAEAYVVLANKELSGRINAPKVK